MRIIKLQEFAFHILFLSFFVYHSYPLPPPISPGEGYSKSLATEKKPTTNVISFSSLLLSFLVFNYFSDILRFFLRFFAVRISPVPEIIVNINSQTLGVSSPVSGAPSFLSLSSRLLLSLSF